MVLFCVYNKLLCKNSIVMASQFIVIKKRLNNEAVDKGLKIMLIRSYDLCLFY
jgi:hypothetical protein